MGQVIGNLKVNGVTVETTGEYVSLGSESGALVFLAIGVVGGDIVTLEVQTDTGTFFPPNKIHVYRVSNITFTGGSG